MIILYIYVRAIIATQYKANINCVSPIVLIALTPSFIFSYTSVS